MLSAGQTGPGVRRLDEIVVAGEELIVVAKMEMEELGWVDEMSIAESESKS